MVSGKMLKDEVEIDVARARRLVAAQFPQWAGLPVAPVHSSGPDNAMFRLSNDKALRFPRYVAAAGQVEKEQLWLPRLAPALPLPIPESLGMGQPAEGYPVRWSGCRWLEGANAAPER